MTAERPPDLAKLQTLVARLRAPDGCPWDREQTLADMRAYLLEEAHEVAAAIDRGELDELAGELGDLLFQVVFLARLGEEQGAFDLAEVIERIHAKMVARHPHVFGGEALPDARAVERAWERRKLGTGSGERRSALAGVPDSLPALVASYRITQKAAAVGFDWRRTREVLAKVREELAEVEAELPAAAPSKDRAAGGGKAALAEELGDLLFSVANLARHLEIDPEAALAACNLKFRRRFTTLEARFAERGRPLHEASLEEMDAVWNQVKAAERDGD